LLQRLVPGVQIETRPRLSQLTHAGAAKLVRLPPRSAIVAFSAAEVYAIAEMIRRRRGGCAVVMGRLSPRTRNAQVALYQEKEVDFLVATDAIGMGLNMDVDHVAFARLSKFDGHRPRLLTASEVAQIAGRAGRGMRDGTFGATADCPPLEDELVRAVESHSFQPLEQIVWRNAALDFSHIDALLASLQTPSHLQGLVRGNDAADLETLSVLARESEIRGLARGRTRVKLLWEACQIPDFRKISDDSHTKLCARVFGHIAKEGKLPTDWIAGQIAALARADGDIDTLMQRLASMRVWTYIAARGDWVADAGHWQGRARAVEDLLSDALHERLTARFVDRRAAHLMRKLESSDADDLMSAVTRRGEVVVEGHQVGLVEGFGFVPDPNSVGDERRMVTRAARRALITEMPRRVARLEAAEDSAFAWLPSQRIAWEGAAVARLRPGASVIRPAVEISQSEFLDGAQRERVRLRLQRYLDQHIHDALTPLFAAAALAERDGALRGPLHRLIEGLGVVPGATEADIPPALRCRLKALDVRAGRFSLFLPALLKPRARLVRAALWALGRGLAVPELPPASTIAIAPPNWPNGFAESIGWLDCGPVLLRLDIAERIAAELHFAARGRPVPVPPDLGQRLAVKAELLPNVLRALGLRVNPSIALAEGQYGPPAPATLSPLSRRRREPEAVAPVPVREGPFAALAALRR
jgi:ATP-dependent RNA helicase SUPV3L1/SUV3